MRNAIKVSAEDFFNTAAAFVDGQFSATIGNTANNFINDQSSASLDEIINTPLDEIINKQDAALDLPLDNLTSHVRTEDLLVQSSRSNLKSNK